MGHLRFGRLPKTRRWIDVVNLLETSPQNTTDIAAGVVVAADQRLKELEADPSLGYCFWLLSRISYASRKPDFQESLSAIGIDTYINTPVLTFISKLTEHVHNEVDGNVSSGHFGEISSLSLSRTLSETVGQYTGSIFGSTVDSLQQAFRAYSAPDQFGHLSQKFFGDFFARTLSSLIDRELSHHVGRDKSYATSADSQVFMDGLKLHARESALIMEDFASGWYSKHNWETRGEISLNEAQGFVAVALRKLRSEFKLGATEE